MQPQTLDVMIALFAYAGNPRENEAMRQAAHQLALAILAGTPSSADQSTSIRLVRESLLWAVQARLHEQPTDTTFNRKGTGR